jgi:hypothetical protein
MGLLGIALVVLPTCPVAAVRLEEDFFPKHHRGRCLLGLFWRNAWWKRCRDGRGRLNLLGTASNEGPGLQRERLPVAMAYSQFHLGELSQRNKMQLKPHDPLRQERLSCDGEKHLLLIGSPAEVCLIGRLDGFDPTQDTVGEGRSSGRKIPNLVRGRLPNLGQARDAA